MQKFSKAALVAIVAQNVRSGTCTDKNAFLILAQQSSNVKNA